MNIEQISITIADLIKGFKDDDDGAFAMDGKLNIRPKYQRNFVYDDKQQVAVINSVFNGFPLNVMYWVKREDGTFEVLDGQQRTISLCKFATGDFAYCFKYAHNWKETAPDKWKAFLDYPLFIYVCQGEPSEILNWFEIINIAGLKLEPQEMRNASYPGPWLADAKKWFSKRNSPAEGLAKDYVTGDPLRQALLERALFWITDGVSKDAIRDYMALHQNKPDAQELWNYFDKVIGWAKRLFPKKRKELKNVPWGLLYNKFKDAPVSDTSSATMEKRVAELMEDDDVTSKSGIYEYLIDGDERHLSIRAFTPKMKRQAYEKQKGICAHCHGHFNIEEMEADHIKPWREGGQTILSNCQMLCKACNRKKGGK